MGINADRRQAGLKRYQISVSGQNSSEEFWAKLELVILRIIENPTHKNRILIHTRKYLILSRYELFLLNIFAVNVFAYSPPAPLFHRGVPSIATTLRISASSFLCGECNCLSLPYSLFYIHYSLFPSLSNSVTTPARVSCRLICPI